MKKLSFVFLLIFPFMVFGQSMNLKWEDRNGREFSINSHSGKFSYSMVSGDKIKYNTSDYYGPKGSVSQIGDVRIKYNTSDYYGPKGSVSQIGGLKIIYNTSDYYGPKGSIKETKGSVY